MQSYRRLSSPHALTVAPVLRPRETLPAILDAQELVPPVPAIEVEWDEDTKTRRLSELDPRVIRLAHRSCPDDDYSVDAIVTGFSTPPSRSGLTAIQHAPTVLRRPPEGTLTVPAPVAVRRAIAAAPPPMPRLLPPPPRSERRPVSFARLPFSPPPRNLPMPVPATPTPALVRRARGGWLMLFLAIVLTSVAVTLLASTVGRLRICAAVQNH
jgi:hypothetical protein